MISDKTDSEVLREFGARIQAYRLQRNLTLEAVAESAGLHLNTVCNAEGGKNPRLETIVRILRVLGRLDALESFLPAPSISPIDLVTRGPEPRRRASSKRG